MKIGALDTNTLLALAAVLLAAGLVVAWIRRRPVDPEEIERRRRAHLNLIGRIVEGQVLEIQEAPPLPPVNGKSQKKTSTSQIAEHMVTRSRRNLILYSYSISGVTYETAQDVTGLEERACLKTVVSGLPVSVKYDPSNPGNSILVADDWSGVH